MTTKATRFERTGAQMSDRRTPGVVSVTIIAVAISAAAVQPSHAEPAANDAAGDTECLSRPNKPTPRGSHWWYRIDRSTRRRCWYLGPERTAERKAVRGNHDKPRADNTSRPNHETPRAAPPAEPDRSASEQPAAETNPPPAAPEPPVAAVEFSAGWPDVRPAMAAPARASAAAADADDGGAEPEDAPDETADDMPLVWPVLTDAERAAFAEATPEPGPSLKHLLLFLLTLAAFVAVAFHTVRELWLIFSRSRSPRAASHDHTHPQRSVQPPAQRALQVLPGLVRRWTLRAR